MTQRDDDYYSEHSLNERLRLRATEQSEFVAHENIRRFKAQLLHATDGARTTIIRELLDIEENHLRTLLAGSE